MIQFLQQASGKVSLAAAIIFLVALDVAVIVAVLKLKANRETTKRKEAEEVLNKRTEELRITKERIEKERDQLRAIFSSMTEGLVVVAKDHRVLLMNQAASILLRISPVEAVNRKIEDVMRLIKGRGETLEENLTGRFIRNVIDQPNIIIIRLEDNFYCKNRTGALFPVALLITSWLGKGGEAGAVIIFRDVTREKEIDRAKTEFATLASHQLQTPLASINWYTELLLGEDLGSLNKEQKEFLEQVYKSSKRMGELVNALLNVSRIELGFVAIEPESTNLLEITEGVLSELAGQIKTKQIEIIKKYDQSLPQIELDPRLTRAILQNLISNSLKYSDKQGKIELEISKQASNVFIKIKDNGCGIPKNVQHKIFTKLFRAQNAVEKEPEGSGLGLYMAKSVLEQAGGKIWFSSAGKDKGATFYVTMPLSGMKKKSGTKTLSTYY